MSLSAIFILDSKGKVLISRNYRGDVEMNVIERFMQLLLEQEDENNLTPIVQHGDVAFMYIKHTNVYCMLFLILNIDISKLFFKHFNFFIKWSP
jgi:AP-1 complex subunit mu